MRPRRQLSGMLPLLLLNLSFTYSSPVAYLYRKSETVWVCNKESRFNYDDCSIAADQDNRCYFQEHFGQYRPCHEICEGSKYRLEERCRSYCPGFHNQYCHIKKVVEEVIEKPIKPVPAQEEPAEEVTSESSKLGWIALPVVLPVALGVIALIFYKYKSHQRKQSQSDTAGEDDANQLNPEYNGCAEGQDNVNMLNNREINSITGSRTDFGENHINRNEYGQLVQRVNGNDVPIEDIPT